MFGNQGADAERGTQKAYEERAAPIQQHIQHRLEEHSRLSTLARQHRPSAQDDVARLIQLHAVLRPLTQQIRNYIVDYLRKHRVEQVIAEFRQHVNRAAWVSRACNNANLFYHSHSLATTPLDYLFAQLLQDVQRTIEDIETLIKAEPSRSSTTVPIASDATHSVARATSDPTSSQTAAFSPNRSPSIRPDPANQRHRTDTPHGGTARSTASNACTFVNSSRRRTGTTGIMGVTDGNVANAIPLAWNAAYDPDFRQGPNLAYATASPVAQPGHTTHSVGPLATEAMRSSEPPRSQRPVDPERQRQLQQSLVNTVSGGRGPSQVTSSNPLQVGADGRPFVSSSNDAAQPLSAPAADFGEDFAREHFSMFYRNATFTRRPAQSQPLPMVREIPVARFDGEIRSYQEFRNRFLEIVEAQRNLEPRHKLLHLLHHLRGEPLRMSEGFPIADESYFSVINLVEQKYGDKTVLKNILTQDIINLHSPKMKREELQEFHDKAFRTVCQLRQKFA